jgi:hypothetical protein
MALSVGGAGEGSIIQPLPDAVNTHNIGAPMQKCIAWLVEKHRHAWELKNGLET